MLKPQYDLRDKTDPEIIIFVRETLDTIELRKRLYPAFVRMSNKCKNRTELIREAEKTLQRANEITERQQSGITKKVILPKRLDHKEVFDKDSSSLERETLLPPSTTSSQKGNTDLDKLSLSVWESLHRFTPDVSDPEQTSRLAYFSKYQDIIKKIIDSFQVLTVSDAVTKNAEAKLKPVSFKVLSRLLNDLYTDGFLDLEIIRCGLRHPAYVFSTKRCSKERYTRYTKRYRESEQIKNGITKKGTRPKESQEEKVNKVVSHNEAVRRKTIEQERERNKQLLEEELKKKPKQKQKTMNGKELDPSLQKEFTKALNKLRENFETDKKLVGHEKATKTFYRLKEKMYRELMKRQEGS